MPTPVPFQYVRHDGTTNVLPVDWTTTTGLDREGRTATFSIERSSMPHNFSGNLIIDMYNPKNKSILRFYKEEDLGRGGELLCTVYKPRQAELQGITLKVFND
jgi:hypothetical protein